MESVEIWESFATEVGLAEDVIAFVVESPSDSTQVDYFWCSVNVMAFDE